MYQNKAKSLDFSRGLIGVLIVVAVSLFSTSCGVKTSSDQENQETMAIKHYTCGMHPSVRVTPEEHNKGTINCPICNMNLTPVYEHEENGSDSSSYYGCGMEGEEHVFFLQGAREGMTCPICGMPLKKISKKESDNLRGVISKVEIKGEQAKLAGVKTEPLRKLHLFKEIRTVGKVAYDPQLAIAQEELVSGLKALDKMGEKSIPEIKERAASLVESSKRKLELLGLNTEQIKELEKTRTIETSFILPEEKMWIYGEIYEYELSWVRIGEQVSVTTASIPGEEFKGVISSLNPVVNPKTRSLIFRAQVDNPDLKLKPEMYVDIIIMSMLSSDSNTEVLAVPKEAVLDTGMRKIVWVDKGDGKYEGKEIAIGSEAVAIIDGRESKFYQVVKGLSEGEKVVTKSNFLIDSQSQLSGTAASAYGGTIGSKEEEIKTAMPAGHRH
ncbi:MAG: efflux RND transporter periplasmic adaptor subunit [Candidatus Omnitrophica bacterium]|nr:efflux RND transporter periplasmic adaptor subunit [Candidatus Omnitrophota bacterium]MBU1127587.1 efflux RND transporter periplasmic adaptor subunit [Candidatus Omnitrophota bacterium]MBU1783874.1 efflux RND transporter periplasmic adaptor subunit [Candidatus Omnitrophota bacterium]MBU1851711.1 efflux RND transporter periplasmic adaptor subunit [Candidatus Omnitrophota bacterium]